MAGGVSGTGHLFSGHGITHNTSALSTLIDPARGKQTRVRGGRLLRVSLTGQQGEQRDRRQERRHIGTARAYHTRARCASTPARSYSCRHACGPNGARRGTGRARPPRHHTPAHPHTPLNPAAAAAGRCAGARADLSPAPRKIL